MGVLLEITIDLVESSASLAKIKDFSYYQGEEEILFSMHPIFRIGEVRLLDGCD